MTYQQRLTSTYIALIAIRVLAGPVIDTALAAGALIAVWMRPAPVTRVSLFWLLLAGITLLQSVLPIQFPVSRLALPGWIQPQGPTGTVTWSYAPWETIRYVVLFAGAGLWSISLWTGSRRLRRRQGKMLRILGLFVAVLVFADMASWIELSAGGNHVAILLVICLSEAALRLKEGDLFCWLTVVVLFVAIIVTEALAPSLFALALIGRGLAPESSGKWKSRSVPVVVGAMMVFFGAYFLWEGQHVGLFERIQIWRDASELLAETFPWGIGFGSFSWVFPAYSVHLPVPSLRALHPENAYLWFLIEGGLPALTAFFVLRGGKRNHGQTAVIARYSLAVLALECLIETPVLWGPIIWLLPLLLGLGFSWPQINTHAND